MARMYYSGLNWADPTKLAWKAGSWMFDNKLLDEEAN
jgi:hypothetical protein